jgi:predicted TPR repeat methyltransferase
MISTQANEARAGSAAPAAADSAASGTPPAVRDESTRLCEEGLALLDRRAFAEAHRLFARARAIDPGHWLAHYRLGLLHNDMGRPGDALICFDVAHALAPDDVRIVNNRGSALQMLGRMPEAEVAFRRACDLAPESEIPRLNLGHLLEQTNRKPEAAAVYRDAIGRGINRPLFEHHLAALTGLATERAPDDWVVATFDNFAPTFDDHLRGLRYEVPRHLARKLQDLAGKDVDIVDLGCGTGGCGPYLAPMKRRLVGVDLSPRMAAQARARNVYDEVVEGEVHAWLTSTADATFDVVCAADVFIYIGTLDTVFAEVHRILRPGGWFAFSTEECRDVEYQLLASGRYAQSEDYVRRLAVHRFDVAHADATIVRMEDGVALPGRLYILQRQGGCG